MKATLADWNKMHRTILGVYSGNPTAIQMTKIHFTTCYIIQYKVPSIKTLFKQRNAIVSAAIFE